LKPVEDLVIWPAWLNRANQTLADLRAGRFDGPAAFAF
jgi:hypothetical protein